MIKGVVYTPPLDDTIYPGIIRDSCIQLLKKWGVQIYEKKIDMNEIVIAAK